MSPIIYGGSSGGGSLPLIGPVSIAYNSAGITTGRETSLVIPANRIADILTFITVYWDTLGTDGWLKLAIGPVGGTFNVDTQDVVQYDLAGGNEGNASATLDPPIFSTPGMTAQGLAGFLHHRIRTKTACAVFAQVGVTASVFTAGSADLYASVIAT